MTMRLPSLNVLRVFESAARHLSFKDAAHELFISPPGVSYQIRVLEKQLNISLFERLNRSLKLTPQGLAYYQKVKKGLNILESATSELLNEQKQKVFNISCIPFLTNALLIPNIQSFKDAYPNQAVHILSQTKRAELSSGEVDVAIRHQKGDETDLHYEWLSKIHITPVCSESYWKGIDNKLQNNLAKHKMINLSVDTNSWPLWLKQFAHDTPPQESIVLDNYQAVMESVKQGLGLAMGFKPILNRHMNDEKLIMPFSDQVSDYGDLYLAYKIEHTQNSEIQAFQNWLKALISQLNSDK